MIECQALSLEQVHSPKQNKAPTLLQLPAEEITKGHISMSCNSGLEKNVKKNVAGRGPGQGSPHRRGNIGPEGGDPQTKG